MRLVVYDFEEESDRKRVRRGLKEEGLHVQLSVFETDRSLRELSFIRPLNKGQDYRIVVFRLSRGAKPIKLGRHFDGSDSQVL